MIDSTAKTKYNHIMKRRFIIWNQLLTEILYLVFFVNTRLSQTTICQCELSTIWVSALMAGDRDQ